MLNGNDPSCGKAIAVADSVDFIDDRHFRIPWAHEIAMQGMSNLVLDGARCGHQRLADHLAAENPLPAGLRRQSTEKIVFKRL